MRESLFAHHATEEAESMYLRTLPGKAARTPARAVHLFNLETRDINGRGKGRRTNAPDRSDAQCAPDPGQAPRKPRVVRRSYNPLLNEDIPGSKSRNPNLPARRNPVNPLSPAYDWPVAAPVEPLDLPFLRDAIAVDDIEGAKPRSLPRLLSRPPKDYVDEEQQRRREMKSRVQAQVFKTLDPNANGGRARSRTTDVLNPVYDYFDTRGKPAKMGFIEGSVPRPLHVAVEHPYDPFSAKDIEGATPLPAASRRLRTVGREQWRATNDVSDLPGASPNALVGKLHSGRNTNPLTPQYNWNTTSGPSFPKESVQRKRGKRVLQLQPGRESHSIGSPRLQQTQAATAESQWYQEMRMMRKRRRQDRQESAKHIAASAPFQFTAAAPNFEYLGETGLRNNPIIGNFDKPARTAYTTKKECGFAAFLKKDSVKTLMENATSQSFAAK